MISRQQPIIAIGSSVRHTALMLLCDNVNSLACSYEYQSHNADASAGKITCSLTTCFLTQNIAALLSLQTTPAMAYLRPSALSLTAILAVLFVSALSVGNGTSTNDPVNKKVGWYDVKYRSTTAVVYSCLSTILACTWTSLHLNLPSAIDTTKTKILRKVKWMILTILFPEFTFGKAVCELQMAAEDWCELKAASANGLFKWRFSDNTIVRWTNAFFQFFLRPHRAEIKGKVTEADTVAGRASTRAQQTLSGAPLTAIPDSRLEPELNSDRQWTLAHSYFANMGGFILRATQTYRESPFAAYDEPGSFSSMQWKRADLYFADKGGFVVRPLQRTKVDIHITGRGLLRCCLFKLDPLRKVRLSEPELLDKAKYDSFTKAIAVLQTFWLTITFVTRVKRRLPVSQLEICTVAFAALNFATYLANWSKPKDVECPVYIVSSEEATCSVFDHYGRCFVHQTIASSNTRWKSFGHERIPNDEFRLQGVSGQFSVLSWTISLSTLVFGTIHCVAWFTDFPSHTERLVWLTASVVSAVLPLLNLLFTSVMREIVTFRVRNRALNMISATPECTSGSTKVLKWINHGGALCLQMGYKRTDLESEAHLWAAGLEPQLSGLITLVRRLYQNGEMDPKFRDLWSLLHKYCDNMQKSGLCLEHRPEPQHPRADWDTRLLNAALAESAKDMKHVVDALKDPNDTWTQHIERLDKIQQRTDKISKIFAVTTWCIYVIARVTILALAFAALRSQDEGVYIATWTRYLPNIG